MLVEKIRSSAELATSALALPMADSELPPRSMMLTSFGYELPVAGSVR